MGFQVIYLTNPSTESTDGNKTFSQQNISVLSEFEDTRTHKDTNGTNGLNGDISYAPEPEVEVKGGSRTHKDTPVGCARKRVKYRISICLRYVGVPIFSKFQKHHKNTLCVRMTSVFVRIIREHHTC